MFLPEIRELLPDSNEPDNMFTTSTSLRQSQGPGLPDASPLGVFQAEVSPTFLFDSDAPPVVTTPAVVGADRRFTIHNATDEDYFKITIAAGLVGTATDYVHIDFSHAEGDLNLQLRDASGREVLRSETTADWERLSLQGLDAGEYTAIVYGASGATAAYDLTTELPQIRQLQLQKVIGPDRLEPNNGAALGATAIRQSEVLSGLTLTAGDQDIFQFTIPVGVTGTSQHYVETRSSLTQGDVDIILYQGSSPTAFRQERTTGPTERMTLEGLTPGTYVIQIFANNNAVVEYDVQFVIPAVVNALPPDPLEFNSAGTLVGNDTLATATFPRIESADRLGRSRYVTTANLHNTNDVDVYEFVIPNSISPERLFGSISVEFASPGAMQLELLNAQGQVIASGTGGQSLVGNPTYPFYSLISLSGLNLPAGSPYFARVRGNAGATGAYQLGYAIDGPGAVVTPDRIEPNDSREKATDLGVIEGTLRVTGGTISKKGGLAGFGKLGQSELDHYRFKTIAPGGPNDKILMLFRNRAGDLDLEFYDADDKRVRISNEGNRDFEEISLSGLPAGEYVIRINGDNRLDTGDYDLTIQAPFRSSGFSIKVVADSSLPSNVSNLFEQAARRWESVILRDLPDDQIPQSMTQARIGSTTLDISGFAGTIVDDLTIFATASATSDGPNGNLASALALRYRSNSREGSPRPDVQGSAGLPYLGIMQFDLADASNPDHELFTLILHEMGHILFPPGLWPFFGLRTTINNLPVFVGKESIKATDQIFGGTHRCVPLEDAGGPGTQGVHWDEELFINELMTGFTNTFNDESIFPNPFSQLTIAMAADMGYIVDKTRADTYPDSFTTARQTGSAYQQGLASLANCKTTAASGELLSNLDNLLAASALTGDVTLASGPLPGGGCSCGGIGCAACMPSNAQSEGEGTDGEGIPSGPVTGGITLDDLTSPVVVSLASLFPADSYEVLPMVELRQSQSVQSLTNNSSEDQDTFMFTLTGRGTAEHFLTVSSELGRNLDLELRDSTGKVLSRGLTGGQTLSLAAWDPGVYTVRATTGDFNKYAVEFSGKFEAGDPTLAALDIDGNGSVNSLQDMRLIQLWKLDYTAEELEEGGFVDPSRGRTGVEVLAYLESLADSLDIDGDSSINSLTDTRLVQLSALDYSAEEFVEGNFIPSAALRNGADVVSRLEGLFIQATPASPALAGEGEQTMGPAQVLTLKSSGGGTSQTITVEYQTVDVNNQPTNLDSQGITFSLFFDSTKLTPDAAASMVFAAPTNGTLRNGLTRIRTDSATNGGADNDPTTDRRLDFQWIADTEEENFPRKATTAPAVLLTLAATITEATSINLVLGDGDSDFMQRSVGAPLALTTTVAAVPEVSVAVAPASVNEDGTGALVYTFTRTGATTDALAVTYTVTGTATSGTDFTALSGTVTIPAGQASATVTVNPTDDTTVEPSETIILTVTDAATYDVGTPATATGTITNDDTAVVTPTVSVAVAPAAVNEDGTGALVYTFTRTGATTAALAVTYTVTGTATSGTDFTALSGTVTIPAGQASVTVSVNPTDDTTIEPNETIISYGD